MRLVLARQLVRVLARGQRHGAGVGAKLVAVAGQRGGGRGRGARRRRGIAQLRQHVGRVAEQLAGLVQVQHRFGLAHREPRGELVHHVQFGQDLRVGLVRGAVGIAGEHAVGQQLDVLRALLQVLRGLHQRQPLLRELARGAAGGMQREDGRGAPGDDEQGHREQGDGELRTQRLGYEAVQQGGPQSL